MEGVVAVLAHATIWKVRSSPSAPTRTRRSTVPRCASWSSSASRRAYGWPSLTAAPKPREPREAGGRALERRRAEREDLRGRRGGSRGGGGPRRCGGRRRGACAARRSRRRAARAPRAHLRASGELGEHGAAEGEDLGVARRLGEGAEQVARAGGEDAGADAHGQGAIDEIVQEEVAAEVGAIPVRGGSAARPRIWSKVSTEPPIAKVKTSASRSSARSTRTAGSAESRSGTGPSKRRRRGMASGMEPTRHAGRRGVPRRAGGGYAPGDGQAQAHRAARRGPGAPT